MPFHSVRLGLPLALAMLASAAAAQAPSTALTTESPPVLSQALQYRSAIGAYQTYADQSIQPWREANDRVQRIGGWRTYAKEVSDKAPVNTEPKSDALGGTNGEVKP